MSCPMIFVNEGCVFSAGLTSGDGHCWVPIHAVSENAAVNVAA